MCGYFQEEPIKQECEVSFIPSKYLLIQFSSDAINNLYFLEAIKILAISYKLEGTVCCSGAHFTCVIQEKNSWIYFNDLCDSLLIFPSLIRVYSHFHKGGSLEFVKYQNYI